MDTGGTCLTCAHHILAIMEKGYSCLGNDKAFHKHTSRLLWRMYFVLYRHIRENSYRAARGVILKEAEQIAQMPDFKGYLSDIDTIGQYVPHAGKGFKHLQSANATHVFIPLFVRIWIITMSTFLIFTKK